MKREEQKRTSLLGKGSIKVLNVLIITLLFLFSSMFGEFSTINSCQGALKIEGRLSVEEGECFELMVAKDNTAYIFTYHKQGNYIEFVDLTNKSNPRRIGRYNVPDRGYVRAMEIHNGILYVLSDRHNETSYTSFFQLIDVTNLTKPSVIGEYQEINMSLTIDIVLYQDYIYLNADKKLLILNQRNKSSIKLVKELPLQAAFIDESDGILYLLNKTLQAFDLTKPEQPSLIGELNNSRLYRMGLKVKGGIVYTLHWWNGIMAVDFKDPERPRIIDKYRFPQRDFDGGGTIFELAISNDYLFASGADTFAFNIRNPHAILRVSKSKAGGLSIAIANEKIIAVHWNYLVVLSLHDQTKYMIELGVSGGIIFCSSVAVVSISLNKKRKNKRRMKPPERKLI